MKTAIIFFVGLFAGCGALFADSAAPTAPVHTQILVLDNDQLIEGEIRREGDHYCIRREAGETSVPAKRVIEVVENRKQAFKVILKRSNTRDWDERIRLIRWCMENGLRDEALIEAKILQKFRPDDSELRALVQGLQTLKIDAVKSSVEPRQPAKFSDKVLEIEQMDYNRESFAQFVSKVQPILMNTCASCHVLENAGSFRLIRATEGDRKASLFNVAASLKQINRSDIAASPLLTKAVAMHGKALHAPLRDRQATAYLYLENWAASAVSMANDEAPPIPAVTKKSAVEEAPASKSELKNPQTGAKFGELSTSQAKPEPQTEAKDQFDPAIFNGTIQPKK